MISNRKPHLEKRNIRGDLNSFPLCLSCQSKVQGWGKGFVFKHKENALTHKRSFDAFVNE